jgi:hypothetical protein
MDCLDHMEVHLHGHDDVRIATTLFELTQGMCQDNGEEFTGKKQTSC